MATTMKTAIILTAGLLDTDNAKTAHGLLRESGRFSIIALVDHKHAGRDAGEVLDGKNRNIPVFENIQQALALKPDYCVVGVATSGGIFPDVMLDEIRAAITSGASIVNGLHDYLSEREDIRELASKHGVELIDVRKPKKFADLRFWTGEILTIKTPIVAVIGTDCGLGKRTTAKFLIAAAKAQGLHAEMIYTGQTGWLQGGKYGFIFDSTLNDFVSGELEHAILTCVNETDPDIILLEGQSALRNPSGPCGAEMLISGQARHVVLVHAPKRKYYDHLPQWGEIPPLETEIELIEKYGSTVIAIALNTQHCTPEEAVAFQQEYEHTLGIATVLPLLEGCGRVIPLLKNLSNTNTGYENHVH